MSEEANVQNAYKCSPREVRQFTVDCIAAGLTPFIRSSPGMGKSSITKGIGSDHNLVLIDERLSTRSPVDLAGIPDFYGEGTQRRATFTPFDVYPTVGTKIPDGKDGWLLFFDEFNSAAKSVQAAAYKVILDKMIGLTPLHENVAIVCAGNLETDRAITNGLSTAMQSRLVHLEMELSHREWLEDVALKEGYDSRIIAYLSYMPSKLMDFRPEHNERTFCCPRTWEFMNRLIKGQKITDQKTKLYQGTITSGVAVDFVQFSKVSENMPRLRDILADPEGMMIPNDPPTRWMVISHLMEQVTTDTLEKVAIYVNRFPSEFRVLFFRALLVKHPTWRTRQEVIRAMSALSRYLHGDDTAVAA